jgi:hypothetical protein
VGGHDDGARDRDGLQVGERVTAPTEQVPTATASPEAAKVDDPSESPAAANEASRSRHIPAHLRPHRWWWRVGFPIALVLLMLAIPTLVWIGSRVVLGSSDGKIVKTIADPAAPGWEATVDPTPVMALALVNEQGQLDSVAVLALTGEGSGSVVVLSSSTVMGVPGIGNVPLSIVYSTGGVDVLREGLQGILGIGLSDIDVIEPSEWSDLVAPVAPLQVTNPDPVRTSNAFGQPGVSFPQGSIDLPANQVWSYLSSRNPGETDLNRLVRIEAFWRAWTSKVGAATDQASAVPGETDSGLGQFVRGLGSGQVDASSLPVRELPLGPGQDPVYEPTQSDVHDLMARIAPFPAGPEGTRAHMTVLDGTGSLDHGLTAAVVFAANGGQIDKVGNAPEFGVATTQFIYYDEAVLTRVQRMRDALGVGEIVKSDELNSASDIVVVLGQDYESAQPDRNAPTPTLAPSGAGG